MNIRKDDTKSKAPENEMSRYAWILIVDLLRWTYLPKNDGDSERQKIITTTHRHEVSALLEANPHLYKFYAKTCTYYYQVVRKVMADEDNNLLSLSPETCPWTAEDILSFAFFPVCEAD